MKLRYFRVLFFSKDSLEFFSFFKRPWGWDPALFLQASIDKIGKQDVEKSRQNAKKH